MSRAFTPATYFAKSERALHGAHLLIEGGEIEGACNRAYYAMFDAARAALLNTAGAEHVLAIKSHSGLISFFSQRLVKTGSVSICSCVSFRRVVIDTVISKAGE